MSNAEQNRITSSRASCDACGGACDGDACDGACGDDACDACSAEPSLRRD